MNAAFHSTTGPGRVLEVRPGLTVVENITAALDAAARTEIGRLAARLKADEPALTATAPFGPRVVTGVGPGPAVFFEDHGEIALAARHGDSTLEYRSMFLAENGDTVVVNGPRHPEFESYCLELSGARHVNVVRPAAGPGRPVTLSARCSRDSEIMTALWKAAQTHGHLTVMPYIGTGNAWLLAGAIAAATTGVEVHVCAPPPRLTRRVNDKLWFGRRVAELLGRSALPPTFTTYGPAALAGHVAFLARRYHRMFVKIPDASGSEGNLVLESSEFLGLSASQIRRKLIGLLVALGWSDTWPLATGVWDCAVIDSPSVQLWIPHAEEGPPIVEGVFSQVTSGDVGEFTGAAPSGLPFEAQVVLAGEAVVIASLLQDLGYYGRCSFDAVLDGDDPLTARIHWIECNGRWGGVSIPLTLANRLAGNRRHRPFVVVQRANLRGTSHGSFANLLRLLEGRLYTGGETGPGLVILSPWRNVAGSGVHFMFLDDELDGAKAAAAQASKLMLEGGPTSPRIA